MYNRNAQPRPVLSLDQVARMAPSVVAQAPAASVSERYEFIPTTNVLSILGQEGWMPVQARQSRAKTAEGKDFVRHEVRLQNERLGRIDDSLPELVLTNSHNGTAAFNLMAGLYRLVCSNGMVAFSPEFGSYKIKHVGFKAEQVLEASYSVIADMPRIAESVGGMQEVKLNRDEQLAFATSALTMRYEDGKSPLMADQLLLTRRVEDREANLWTTFNSVQENLIKGGLRGVTTNERGQQRRARTRAITSVTEDVRLNRALWMLAEEMRKIKVG